MRPGRTTTVDRRLSTSRKMVLGLMLLLFALPVPLTLAVRYGPRWFAGFMSSPPLTDAAKPALKTSIGGWWNGQFQSRFESWFNDSFEPRGWIIRATNQLYYSTFRKSYMLDREIIVGRDQTLYARSSLNTYCYMPRKLSPEIVQLVARIGDLSAELRKRQKALVLLFTPNKAITEPELLPGGICPPPESPETLGEAFVAALRNAGVATLDGAALARSWKRADPIPPFPRGGVHWSTFVGKRVAAALMPVLAGSAHTDFGAIYLGAPTWSNAPTGIDTDLALLLNTLTPPLDYSVGGAAMNCQPRSVGRSTTLFVIGGSFAGPVADAIASCGLFREVDYFFYYTNWLKSLPDGAPTPVVRDDLRWRTKLDSPSAFLLEANESLIPVPSQLVGLSNFVDDALAALREH